MATFAPTFEKTPHTRQNPNSLALKKSISGIRGTIGGRPDDNLTPVDLVLWTSAFGTWLRGRETPNRVVIGRDGRMSGAMVQDLVSNTLRFLGIDVIDLGLSTTPTVEMAVPDLDAGAGIILTASHNPREWNALKLLDERGEFITQTDLDELKNLVENQHFEFAEVDDLGKLIPAEDYLAKHIQHVLDHELVDADTVRARDYHVIVDCVNSTGAIAVPALLDKLGVAYTLLNAEVTGDFAHNPEPLPKNLQQLAREVESSRANLGIAVDPDVDRLAFVSEDGRMFGEEYTLVAVADYILQHREGGAVSNLSSTRALRDVAHKHGRTYTASAVGEVNVVTKMKETGAVIGGEGNGGVIVPDLHYGRDALAGIALFLTHLAKTGGKASELRRTYPSYFMSKNKIELDDSIDLSELFDKLAQKYKNAELNTIDGLKIDLEEGWIHIRPSNTEPIIRIYTESTSTVFADNLAKKLMADVNEILKG